jgi:hypothetical protein
MSSLKAISQLRVLLRDMERSLGLSELTDVERDLLSAAAEVSMSTGTLKTADLMTHKLTSSVPRASFFRALRVLDMKGYLVSDADLGKGWYRLNPELKE